MDTLFGILLLKCVIRTIPAINMDTDDETDDEDEGFRKPELRPCKPPPPPQRRSDPKNGPWTRIKKKYPEHPF